MDALVKWGEENISPYCLSKCQKTCCDFGAHGISISKATLLKLLSQEEKERLEKNPQKMNLYKDHPFGSQYRLTGVCPQYSPETKQCQIREERPGMCRIYPFSVEMFPDPVWKGRVIIKPGCPASKDQDLISKLTEFAANYDIVNLLPI